MKNIENVKKEIKEKINKSPRYINPTNKEFQEDIKKYGFNTGYEYICWLRQNQLLSDISTITRRYNDKKAQRKGYKTDREYQKAEFRDYKNEWNRNYRYENGIQEPMDSNGKCSSNFGVFIGEGIFEKYLLTIFEHVKKMDYGNPGFDFVCKNVRQEFIDKYPQFKLRKDEEYRIQLKVRCLINHCGSVQWIFNIEYNNKADYFILAAWDDRNNLNLLHLWLFHKDDMIRGRSLWNRTSLTITNRSEYLEKFKSHEIIYELETIKRICNEWR